MNVLREGYFHLEICSSKLILSVSYFDENGFSLTRTTFFISEVKKSWVGGVRVLFCRNVTVPTQSSTMTGKQDNSLQIVLHIYK